MTHQKSNKKKKKRKGIKKKVKNNALKGERKEGQKKKKRMRQEVSLHTKSGAEVPGLASTDQGPEEADV